MIGSSWPNQLTLTLPVDTVLTMWCSLCHSFQRASREISLPHRRLSNKTHHCPLQKIEDLYKHHDEVNLEQTAGQAPHTEGMSTSHHSLYIFYTLMTHLCSDGGQALFSRGFSSDNDTYTFDIGVTSTPHAMDIVWFV